MPILFLVLKLLCLELQNWQPNMCAVLQVDVLMLTVERLGSASKGLCGGGYRNLESLTVTHIMREDDVQVRWAGSRAGAACWTRLSWQCCGESETVMGLLANLMKGLSQADLLWCRFDTAWAASNQPS